MGKRKASDSRSPANENINITDNSKKQINKLLLQSANLTFKNHLLQKGLVNDVQHILNKKISQARQKSERNLPTDENKPHYRKLKESYSNSDSSDSEAQGKNVSDIANRKVNTKFKKMKEELVSSSSESSEEDAKIDMSNIKKERVSTTEESELSDSSHLSTIRTVKKPDSSGDSENDGSDPGEKNEVKNKFSSPVKRSIKNKYSSSSKSEADSESSNEYYVRTHLKNKKPRKELHGNEYDGMIQLENERPNQELGVIETASTSGPNYIKKGRKKAEVKQSPKKMLSMRHSSEDDEDTENNLPSRQMNEAFNLNNGNNRSHKNSDSSEAEDEDMHASNRKSLDGNEKMMDQIEKRIQKLNSGNISVGPSKSKVNVLQNVLVAPSKPKSLEEKLGEVYPGIKQIKSNIKLKFSKSEDVYLFRIPKNVDPYSLKDAKINLEEECKLNIGEKYCIKPTPKIPDPTLVISDNGKIVQFKGNIKMQKYVKSKKEPIIEVPEKTSVPLPEDLKKRHPLFGPRYKRRIKLSEEVEKKLDEAIVNLLVEEEKPKKKPKKVKPEEGNQEDIFALLNSHSLSKKKIKKEASDDSAFCSSSSIEKASKKNKKGKNFILNETIARIKSEVPTENDSDNVESKLPKKKKNKLKKETGEVSDEKSNRKSINKISENERIMSPASNHDNRLSMINSTLMTDVSQTPNFYSEISRIGSQEFISERQSTKPNFDPEFSKSEESDSKKKSKKKRESDKDRSIIEKRLISDILDSFKDDQYRSKKLKRKKIRKSEERVGST